VGLKVTYAGAAVIVASWTLRPSCRVARRLRSGSLAPSESRKRRPEIHHGEETMQLAFRITPICIGMTKADQRM
jgi:hypothetical protein